MSQYPHSAATTSDGGYGAAHSSAQDLSRGHSTATSAGFAGRGAGGYELSQMEANPMPVPRPTGAPMGSVPAAGSAAMMGVSAGAGAMGSKQREAYAEQQRYRVQNQGNQYGQYGDAGAASGSSPSPMTSPTPTQTSGGVTVHQDAGILPDESEIPPT
jgi:hypothetical protein